MRERTPAWISAVLCFLLLAAAREHLRPRASAAIRARAGLHGVEHDPRRMNVRELRQLPGVGPRLAALLAAARDTHRGVAPLAWEEVPGIGPKRGRAIRAWCEARGVAPDPLAEGDGLSGRYAPVMSALHWSLVAGLAGLGLVAPGCRETGGESGGEAEASPRSAPGRVTVCSSTLLGGALHVREAGPEAGPVVILLHGMRYSAATWDELGTLSLLGARGYRALALDWPGFGATPEWNGAPDAATLLASVLNDLGADRVALVGASMGGGSALEFLAHSPQRVAAFVGLAPAGSAGFAPQEWATPTLLVWGERDEVLPLATGRALAGRLNARLEVLPGASHAAYLEQVEPFHAVLLAFLADSWPVAGRR